LHEADVLVKTHPRPLISVIIPALNEADEIEAAIDSVRLQSEPHEIIVVDGGSEDATPALARRHARIITSTRGRARQMNRGATAAHGDILLFLHADSTLPPGGLTLIRAAIADGAESGAFRLAFDSRNPLLLFYSSFTRLPFSMLCFGDRGIFTRRDVFKEIGGYPDIPLFEDLELVRMLNDRRRFAFLADHVTTSARRFVKHGYLRQQLRNTYLWLHYVAGTNPRDLAHLYPYE